MKEAQQIVDEYWDARTFRARQLPSRSVIGTFWRVRLLYGGTREKPLTSCTCPHAQFQNTCFHIDALLSSMNSWDWMRYVHHDDIKNGRWHEIAEALNKN